MDFNHLDQQLRDSLADLRLSNEERDELRQLGSELSSDQVRFMRNRAFALARELMREPTNVEPVLKWLEQVIKTLDSVGSAPRVEHATAHFSPGESCRRKIRDLAARRARAWRSASTPSPTISSAKRCSPAMSAASRCG